MRANERVLVQEDVEQKITLGLWIDTWMITTTMLKSTKQTLFSKKKVIIDSIISLYEREMGSFEKATIKAYNNKRLRKTN
jgi:hypothetical protein